MNWEVIENYPDAEREAKWFDFLADSTYPSHYTSPGFFLEPRWENRHPFAVFVEDGERIVAVACGLRGEKQIACGLAVRPQVAFSKTVDQREAASTLARAVLEAAGKQVELITLHCPERTSGFAEFGFVERRAAGTDEVVALDLTKGAEQVFKGFSQSRRADLRKAMRENQLQISPMETIAEVEEIHPIHVAWCARKNIEPDSLAAMLKILELKDYCRVFLARHAGKIVAASFFRFCPGGIVEYSANNSLPEYRHLRPNDLLVWHSIEWACAAGFKRYGMGGSHLFLRRFGGEITASYRYRLDRSFLKKHEKKEMVRDLAIKTYQSMPASARQKIKQLAGRE